MPFLESLLQYRSLSIVGLEKNTGKTECFNYILKRLPLDNMKIAVSSIGVDGESIDQVTQSVKPEIFLREGIYFTTSEKHYRGRKLLSELLDISEEETSLGRLVTAKALSAGKILLSGASSTASLKRWMEGLKAKYGVDLIIIDGALSRLSLASPAISESMILATGAALSANIQTLVAKTAFMVELIGIEKSSLDGEKMVNLNERGVWAIDERGALRGQLFDSAFTMKYVSERAAIKQTSDEEESGIAAVFVSGALTDRLLNTISEDKELLNREIIVRDFTKIFVTPVKYRAFLKKGGSIKVLQKSRLIAVTVNPTAPNGVILNSEKLIKRLSEEITIPVYDIFNHGH